MLVAHRLIILLASFINYKILYKLWLSGLEDGWLDEIITTWLGMCKTCTLTRLDWLSKILLCMNKISCSCSYSSLFPLAIYKILNNWLILMFKVSKWPYWHAQYDGIIFRWCHFPPFWWKIEINNTGWKLDYSHHFDCNFAPYTGKTWLYLFDTLLIRRVLRFNSSHCEKNSRRDGDFCYFRFL